MHPNAKDFLESVFRAALSSVEPGGLVRGMLREQVPADMREVYIVGGGKAARAMGEGARAALDGRLPVRGGVLAAPRGRGGASGPLRYVEAGHPLPDAGSREAARAMLGVLGSAGKGDLVLALLSGGGSAMISAPAEGVGPGDKARTVDALLRAGADIAALNAVRKHLSAVKGGRMAAAVPPGARVLCLLLSDVPGDDPSVIASGPFSPDPTTYGDALAACRSLGVLPVLPEAVRRHLEAGAGGRIPETPKPGDPVFDRAGCAVVGSNRSATEAAAAACREKGIAIVSARHGLLSGEARECAGRFVGEMEALARRLPPGASAALVAGGETTVRVTGNGTGGRCQEFALAAALAMEGRPAAALLCAGTDGIDGPTDAAGAFADGETCRRARAKGLAPEERLADNDACRVFAALGDLLVTGPTGTNVADVAIGLVGSAIPGARRRRGTPLGAKGVE